MPIPNAKDYPESLSLSLTDDGLTECATTTIRDSTEQVDPSKSNRGISVNENIENSCRRDGKR